MQQLATLVTILLLALNTVLLPIIVNAQRLSTAEKADSLKAVTVHGRKPPIEVKADRTIVNVEGSTNSVGQNALDLLRKSPGITVDKDDNISFSGKTGIKIYIDGRQVPLNGTDLADYLKTLQSSDIESIELIANPSARYDAAGNAGIINIRLRKNKAFGDNGSLTGGYYIGTHSNYNGGLALNHRDAHLNWFGNYNYNNTTNTTHMDLYRIQLDTLFDQHSNITPTLSSHTFKTGLDYFLNKNNTLGVMVDGSLTNFSIPTSSNTHIYYLPDGTTDNRQPNRILEADNSAHGYRNNGNLDLNYHHIDSLGHELTMDGDYGIYRIHSDQFQPNLYFTPDGGSLMYSDIFDMLAPTDIDIYTFKTDYDQNFKKGKLDLGLKTSYVTSSNDFRQYDVVATTKLQDTLNSSNFLYKENINAVYANYSRPFKGWAIQAGLRVENTNAKGTSNGYREGITGYQTYDSVFNRHYTDFFPSGAITYNKNPAQQWTLTYSRRIDRPAYQDLNPFEFKLDEYTYRKGNTTLRPQYTNSVGLSYVYKTKLVATLNYSHVKDVFTQLVDTIDRSKAFLIKENLATQDITSLNISYPWQLGRYSIFANVNAYYSLFNANFGAGRTVDLHVFAVNAFVQQSFRIGKDWMADLSGFYTSPAIWQGTFKTHALGNLDAGISKSVLQKKGSVKLSVSDVFYTLHWTAVSDFAGQYLRATGHTESRQLKLYFTYKFGNAQVKAARTRKTGAEEESKRVGAQGGGGLNN
ncbi:outer membrane beta-barrel family protein [Puia dinghuensis]|uniref:TonB-dependent receptor n=1 Tax=Puia dinghuensis TaxID=1792502 RepID=A0A8J2UBT7_9BACT|nr:outer membrane beta-barrel family protein [Puia dinghuensis]GGA95634.1 TonB-dependent receptor [Puia dinghuensis]